MEFKVGDTIVFTGCDDMQHGFGSHTGNYKLLQIDSSYVIEHIEVHSWHTKLYLVGYEGSFNSVCFELKEN